MRRSLSLFLALATVLPLAARAEEPNEYELDVRNWKVIDRESGPINYYRIVNVPEMPYIHSEYQPQMETAVLGYQVPEETLDAARRLRWTWRAVALPRDGNECLGGHGDSAATVYVTWKRGLRYYTLKYVWSTSAPKASICARRRNPFVAMETIVQETGGPVGVWKTEEIDLKDEFRRHFENGDPSADVPSFLGVAIMSDGDQTNSTSAADFARFVLVR
jgi:hypothetical protein